MLVVASANWRRSTIGELIDEGGSIQTGPFGTKLKASEYTPTGVPVISVGEVGYGRLRLHYKTPRVNETVTSRMSEYLLKEGDIVFGRKGAVDRAAQVQGWENGWFLGSDGIRVRLPETVCSKYIAYHLQLRAHREWMFQHAAGSTMPSLNEGIIRRIPVLLPPLDQQRAIASVLGSLDDKIELNRRMNRTLEQMAAAIFKAWFVDFEPIRAKASGAASFPGMPQPVFDALPATFADTELGPIPEGWKVGPLGNFYEVGIGGAWGEDAPIDKAIMPIRCLRGIDLHNLAESTVPDVPVRFISPNQYEKRQLQTATILVEGSGSFCGRSLLFLEELSRFWSKPICYSNFVKRLDPVCSVPQSSAIWMQLHAGYRAGVVGSYRTGTAFPNLDIKGVLSQVLVVLPPEYIAEAFHQIFVATRGHALWAESLALAETRDALLPKLLSGEVRIGEPDTAEAVA